MASLSQQLPKKQTPSSLGSRYFAVICLLGLLTALVWLLIEQGLLPSLGTSPQEAPSSHTTQTENAAPPVTPAQGPEASGTASSAETSPPAQAEAGQTPDAPEAASDRPEEPQEQQPPTGADAAPVAVISDNERAGAPGDAAAPTPPARQVQEPAPDRVSVYQMEKQRLMAQFSSETKRKLQRRATIRKPSSRLQTAVQRRSAAYELAILPQENLDPHWESLIIRLMVDGFAGKELVDTFSRLGPNSYSPAYMAAKITELYGVAGMGINRDEMPEPELPADYEAPIPDVTIASCLAFIKKYDTEFKDIKNRYGVPAHVIIGLLLIETRLGSDLGKDSALRALASMAATDTAAKLGSGRNSAQAKRIRLGTLEATLKEKSDWAYNEVRALVRYGNDTGADLCKIPGSIYGAMGICQFMPSNIAPFGVDGDGDGHVNMFSVVDAMYSVASYLEANGWRGARSADRKHAVIRSYNHDDYYASQVLAVADRLELGLKGKLSPASSALAGIGLAAPRVLDPSLRHLRRPPPSTHIKSLGSYRDIVK